MTVLEMLVAAAKKKTPLRDLDLRGAELGGAKLFGLRGDFLKLHGANLAGANLGVAHLMDCDFVDADVTGARFGGATLWQCSFANARGDGAQFHSLRGGMVWLHAASLVGATFSRAELDHSSFDGALLDRSVFDQARADDSDFTGASLAGASLIGCSLRRANLSRADLRGANLTLADLREADLRGARREGAIFAGANIQGATFDGPPPDTAGAPPSADPQRALVEYLRACDMEKIRSLWSWWPPHYDRAFACHAANTADAPPEARASLIDLVLDDPDDWIRFVATSTLAEAGDVPVPHVIERLAARLADKPIDPPDHPGVGRGKRDIGLFAAMALAARSEPDALHALDVGLAAKKADVRERCANALAARAAHRGEAAALTALARHADARIRAGAVTATLRFLQQVRREAWRDFDATLVDTAIALVLAGKKDPSPAVQRAARRHPVDLNALLSKRPGPL